MNFGIRTREALTGRTRGRQRRFFRTLILQVEVLEEHIDVIEASPRPPMPGANPAEWEAKEKVRIAQAWRQGRTFWRDATEDAQFELLSRNVTT